MKKLSVTMTRREATLTWIYWAFQLIFLPVLLFFLREVFLLPDKSLLTAYDTCFYRFMQKYT